MTTNTSNNEYNKQTYQFNRQNKSDLNVNNIQITYSK
jgi:hypothetical protein